MKILTEKAFIYTLMPAERRRGFPEFKNRWYASISFDPSVPDTEREEVTALLGASHDLLEAAQSPDRILHC